MTLASMASNGKEAPPKAVMAAAVDVESPLPPRPSTHICSQLEHSSGATLSWRNIVVTVRDSKGHEKQVLKQVSGYLEPGHMLAIMGPSGCGKSTMLDTLAGRLASNAKWTGEIRVNGHESRLSYGKAAYVTQDEVMIGTLTVRETLMYAALLRLPDQTTAAAAEVVNVVIRDLGLSDAADTYIGNWHLRGISGGQRRRVSIGCELVTAPPLLFLDEPTSGLDAAAAYHVVSIIRKLCGSNRTIVSVIHQPSSEVFDLFDCLCLLAEGHRLFYGPANQAIAVFGAAGLPCPAYRNPADHLLHAINRDFDEGGQTDANVAALLKAFDASPFPGEVEGAIEAVVEKPREKFEPLEAGPSALFQTIVLTKRTFVNNLRNVGVFWMRLAMYVMLCLCIGFIYFQLGNSWVQVYSRAALLFFVVAFLTFMAISGFPSFIEDMKVFIRERLNGYYGVMAFVVSNTLASLPFIFLISLVSSVCVYFLAGLDSSGDRFPYFILDLFVSLVVVESIMMAIAPLVPHYLMGIAAGAGLLGIFMLVCGFFQPVAELPAPVFRYPLHYMSFHTYAFSGFMNNEFQGTSNWQCPCSTQPGGCATPCTYSGEQVLEYWNIPGRNKWYVDLLILVGMAFLYRTLFYLTCKYKEIRSK